MGGGGFQKRRRYRQLRVKSNPCSFRFSRVSGLHSAFLEGGRGKERHHVHHDFSTHLYWNMMFPVIQIHYFASCGLWYCSRDRCCWCIGFSRFRSSFLNCYVFGPGWGICCLSTPPHPARASRFRFIEKKRDGCIRRRYPNPIRKRSPDSNLHQRIPSPSHSHHSRSPSHPHRRFAQHPASRYLIPFSLSFPSP